MNSVKIKQHIPGQNLREKATCFIICFVCFGLLTYACMALYPLLNALHGYFNNYIEAVNIKIRNCYP